MKLFRTIAAATFFAAITIVTANAQAPAGRQPAASPAPAQGGAAGVVADTKMAIIDLQAFGDQKAGIARLINAYSALDREVKPRRDEIQQLRTRYEQIVKDIDATKNLAKPEELNAKAEQAANLEKDIKRKQEDGQAFLEKREGELTAPVWTDINRALRAFAAQRGITVIFEKSKLEGVMFVVNDGADITRAFIADYNQRNPASAASTATPANR
ncbi:MAG TPA: OmpH family outer membrane protein [Pyrinomonadaceae bacterium]|nr:OmpH family outer membrane protein [Pyrinomonadaceae bacterium]